MSGFGSRQSQNRTHPIFSPYPTPTHAAPRVPDLLSLLTWKECSCLQARDLNSSPAPCFQTLLRGSQVDLQFKHLLILPGGNLLLASGLGALNSFFSSQEDVSALQSGDFIFQLRFKKKKRKGKFAFPTSKCVVQDLSRKSTKVLREEGL